jgi:tRNA modification GTPase
VTEGSDGHNTIYALSSGAPPAAIAIVRVSGPKADAVLRALSGDLPHPRRAALRTLSQPGTGEQLDRALVLRFPGPESVTGEDVVELHLHGGRAVVAGLLHTLATLEGVRPALPGEFTRRAFENGRIDLAEAEGLADLLQAETQGQRRAALALASGGLSRRVEQWQNRLLTIAAGIEAMLDFSDESDVEEGQPPDHDAGLAALAEELRSLLQAPPAERLRDGVRVVIAGPPNAGKSSLLNRLSGRRAAITSAIAGTTRDVIEAPTAIGGTPFVLVDTAGLRASEDEVEAIGVELARQTLDRADLILWLGAPDECPVRERSILVQSKADLRTGPADPKVDLSVSAETGEGMEALIALLVARARELLPGESELAIHKRHREALSECLKHLAEARSAPDVLIAAESIRLARGALDRITGRAGVENMLDRLFGTFCIGK